MYGANRYKMNPTNLTINPKNTRTIQMAGNNTYISLWILSEISYLKMLDWRGFFLAMDVQ